MGGSVLEVCVDSVESAIAAARGGATRLELCANLIIGGTTPGTALFREIRKYTDIPIHVLMRPRFGDFCYTEHEFSILKEEVTAFRDLGAEGAVIGILTPDGNLDTDRMGELMERAEGMSVTLHRAFDVCRDPHQALSDAVSLGINTILTSGQKNSCLLGEGLLGELVSEGGERIVIQAGGGVNADVIRQLYQKTGVRAYHMSGKRTMDSVMRYRREDVSMGIGGISEYEIWRTDEQMIRDACRTLEELLG